jgi:Ca2+/Na+ antiporter
VVGMDGKSFFFLLVFAYLVSCIWIHFWYTNEKHIDKGGFLFCLGGGSAFIMFIIYVGIHWIVGIITHLILIIFVIKWISKAKDVRDKNFGESVLTSHFVGCFYLVLLILYLDK